MYMSTKEAPQITAKVLKNRIDSIVNSIPNYQSIYLIAKRIEKIHSHFYAEVAEETPYGYTNGKHSALQEEMEFLYELLNTIDNKD